MKQSSGTLLYRSGDNGVEVLFVHASGNYNRDKPWSIPKGEVEDDDDLESTARRETLEETGMEAGELVELGHIDYQKSKKRVHCFASAAAKDAQPRCTPGKSIRRGSCPSVRRNNCSIPIKRRSWRG